LVSECSKFKDISLLQKSLTRDVEYLNNSV
jgi:hypothetical protein